LAIELVHGEESDGDSGGFLYSESRYFRLGTTEDLGEVGSCLESKTVLFNF